MRQIFFFIKVQYFINYYRNYLLSLLNISIFFIISSSIVTCRLDVVIYIFSIRIRYVIYKYCKNYNF